MHKGKIDSVTVRERVNGWWVTVRYQSGREEHHGPYIDAESARSEVELLTAPGDEPQIDWVPASEGRAATVAPDGTGPDASYRS